MNVSRLTISLLVFLAPLIALGIWKIRKNRRLMRQAELEALPFVAPEPKPVPSFLLRFDSAERGYLLQSLKMSGGLFLLYVWTYIYVLNLGIMNIAPNAAKWSNQAALDWLLFLRSVSGTTQTMATMPLLTAFMVVGILRFGPDARFNRTRPMRLNFIFWSRFLPITIALFGGILVGCSLGVGIVYLIKGPIWHNLPSVIPRTLGPDDADVVQEYADLLATSAPRIFLSLLTTTALFFSLACAVMSLPSRRFRPGNVIPLLLPILLLAFVPLTLLVLNFSGIHGLSNALFIYNELGPPPPYSHALFSIGLSIALLTATRHFVRQIEL